MTNVNTDGLPPEMQERIAQIIEGAKQKAAQVPAPQPVAAPAPAPVQRTPSLLEHTVALRQEVQALRQEVAAVGQVTEAVGNAVGQMYQAFFQQSQEPTYSSAFETQGSGSVASDDF